MSGTTHTAWCSQETGEASTAANPITVAAVSECPARSSAPERTAAIASVATANPSQRIVVSVESPSSLSHSPCHETLTAPSTGPMRSTSRATPSQSRESAGRTSAASSHAPRQVAADTTTARRRPATSSVRAKAAGVSLIAVARPTSTPLARGRRTARSRSSRHAAASTIPTWPNPSTENTGARICTNSRVRATTTSQRTAGTHRSSTGANARWTSQPSASTVTNHHSAVAEPTGTRASGTKTSAAKGG